jgi:flagellar hook-length control protein FliK
VTNDKTGETSEDSQPNDEPVLSALSMLAGAALVQPAAAIAPSPEFESALPEVNISVTNASTGWTQAAIPEISSPAQVIRSASEALPGQAAPIDQAETVAMPAGVISPESSSEDAASFSQELVSRVTRAGEVAEAGSSSPAPISTESKPTLQPKTETPVDGLKLAAQPAAINAPQPSSEVQAAATPAALQLPDVPALHQIVEKINLITRQGESEVRLQLHPESLGQVLIQLHLSNGDVSVRMLTETVQAQNLIQDHLAQLKAAFTAQGLPLNNLAVGIGSDASAFDMQRRQPNDWPQGAAHRQVTASTGEVSPPVISRSELRPGYGLHRVDYQV